MEDSSAAAAERPALESVVEGAQATPCPRLLPAPSPFGGRTAAWVILDLWQVEMIGHVYVRGGSSGADPPAEVAAFDSAAELGGAGAGVACEPLQGAPPAGAGAGWQAWECNTTGR